MVSKWMCTTAIVVATLGISACVAVEEAPYVASDRAPLFWGTENCEDSTICHTAQQAYVYGYPLMLMEYTKRALMRQPGGQVNRFLHKYSRPNPSETAVVRPNEDTLYSVAFLDLSDGPQILDVPEVRDRYFLLQLLDGWSTSIAGSPGTANTGPDAQRLRHRRTRLQRLRRRREPHLSPRYQHGMDSRPDAHQRGSARPSRGDSHAAGLLPALAGRFSER